MEKKKPMPGYADVAAEAPEQSLDEEAGAVGGRDQPDVGGLTEPDHAQGSGESPGD